MDLEFQGKVALITGAGQGVGREIARVLAAEGASVVVNDFYKERAEAVASEISKTGGRALGIQCDVTDRDHVKTMISKAVEAFGPMDILINNAGVPVQVRSGEMKRTYFVDIDPANWRKDIDLSFYGCLNCTHSVLPSMIERKEGRIINIISEAGRMGDPNLSVYSGAKGGVLAFSKALAREVGQYRVGVNCVALGATAHEGLKGSLSLDAKPETDQMLQKVLKSYPVGMGLGRIGRPWDVAYAVAFLASPKACYITGQCLGVNGGFAMI